MKVTKPSTIVENKKIQLTEEELKKVSVDALQDDELDLVTGGVRTYGPTLYRLKSRSALPCAMRSLSAALTGSCSRNARASAIDPYG